MSIKPKPILVLLKEAYKEWVEDDAPRLGAALAYYTVFSLAPMLIIVIGVVTLVWSGQSDQMQVRLLAEIERLIGPEGAGAIEMMLAHADRPGSGGLVATVVGVAALLFGATGVFAQLQGSLNVIWNVRTRPGNGLLAFLRQRLLSFGMVLGIGFLLLVFLVVSALLAALGDLVTGITPGLEVLMQVLNFAVSFAVSTGLFAMIYRVLPDVQIAWRDVWIGAAFTSLLFTIGKLGIGYYLGNTGAASAYGAAGSLVVLLLWVFYSAQILFFGAELTQVYARHYGRRIEPSAYAYRVSRPAPVLPGAPAASPLPAAAPGVPAPAPRRAGWKRAGLLLLVFWLGRSLGRRGQG